MNKIQRYIIPLLFFLFACRPLSAQDVEYVPLDSAYMMELENMMVQAEKEQQVRDLVDRYEKRMLQDEMSYHWDGFAELLRGGVDSWRRNGFYKTQTEWHERGDDILEYGVAVSPLAVAWGLKMLGVESRSTFKRMFVSNALAMGFTVGLSSGLKELVSQRRPTGRKMDSMPSRHAAIAFAGATILHREYGHVSPWVSVGGYSAATLTEFLRLHDNTHWAKDIYVGAGIGIVSTNLAYYLTDRIFGVKEIYRPRMTMADIQRVMRYNVKPSALSLVSGVEWGSNHDDGVVYGTTFSSGLEYSHFLNSNFALELLGRAGTTEAYAQDNPLEGFNVDTYHFDAAAKYSYMSLPTMRVAGRVLGGTRLMTSTADGTADSWCGECGVGVSVNYLDKERYSVGVACDYVHSFSSKMRDRWVVNACWNIIL